MTVACGPSRPSAPRRHRAWRLTAATVGVLVVAGTAGCQTGARLGADQQTLPSAATAPAATAPAATAPAATAAAPGPGGQPPPAGPSPSGGSPAASTGAHLTDAEVAGVEAQLDRIDQLLADLEGASAG